MNSNLDDKGRILLDVGTELSLLQDTDSDSKTFRTFIIDGVKSTDGASVISYIAHCKEGLGFKGILKEFYPVSDKSRYRDNYAPYLTRNNSQLVYDVRFSEKKEEFKLLRDNYVASYKILSSTKEDEKEKLQKFIPAFEIYSSIGGDTIYIWTQEPPLETFEEVCDKIHKAPFMASEKKLGLILNSIRTLSIHINRLHICGFLHRDIKPSNFGFLIDENEQTLDQTLSLFDVDSICYMENRDELRRPIGTPGFMSPETMYMATIRTDVYSIGATLFYAMVSTSKTKNKLNSYCYEDQYYDDLKMLVDNSDLIKLSDYNQNPRLREILTKILKKTLYLGNIQANVYESCEGLIRDLESALDFIPCTEKIFFEKKWVLADIDKEGRLARERSIMAAALHHLCKYPLYKGMRWDTKKLQPITVLIIGFTYYCQKFLDACIQALQMPGSYPRITVFYDNEKDVANYKNDRVELFKFFEENDGITDIENYGTIRFIYYNNFSQILKDYEACCTRANCIFIDIGEGMDEKNKEIATLIRTKNEFSMIHYTDNCSSAGEEEVRPRIYTFNPHGWKPDVTMERMALNVHTMWNDKKISYESVEEDFRDLYNYNSSISNALSIKYKLYGIGIDMDSMTNEEAAECFSKKMETDGETLISELMYYEHRRWVTEKICEGWRQKRVDNCIDGITNDKDNLMHVCLVKGGKNQRLYEYENKSYDIWDKEKDLSMFDDLDRMSIELHRRFVAWGSKLKKDDTYIQSIELIESIIRAKNGDNEIKKCFYDWKTCMTDIRENGKQRAGSYEGLKESFLSLMLKTMSSKNDLVRYNELEEAVQQLDRLFRPILLSQKCIDYKRYDYSLIKAIPFILTNQRPDGIVVPLDPNFDSICNGIFNYVESATILKPRCVAYISYIQTFDEISKLNECINIITRYFHRRNIVVTANWIVIGKNKLRGEMDNELPGCCCKMYADSKKEIKKAIVSVLREKDKYIFENNQTYISSIICSSKELKIIGSFSRDHDSGDISNFMNIKGVDYLKYIERRDYLDVAEVIMLGGGENQLYKPPEFYKEYETMWNWYRKKRNNSTWKNICQVLGNYHSIKDEITTFSMKDNKKEKHTPPYEYIMPITCKKSVEKILEYLKEEGIIKDISRIEAWQSDTIRVLLFDCRENHTKSDWDKIFYPSYRLFSDDLIDCYTSNKQRVHIVYHNLILGDDFNLVKEVDRYNRCKGSNISISESEYKDFIVKMKSWNLIDNIVGEKFSYTSTHAKKILTSAGKLLEIYLFHELKASGKFDDIVCGYEIINKDHSKNEIDIILTRGFKTYFIECKARSDLSEDFYNNLVRMRDLYGINAKTIMISDLGVDKLSENNRTIISKMEQKGVITIWKRNQISDISKTLESL